MNRPEVGRWLKGSPLLADFAHLDQTVVFADAGYVTNPAEPNPDAWREDPSRPCLYFRTPNDLLLFNNDPQRAVNRHDGTLNLLYADGHYKRYLRASEVGFQYPKGDPRARWDLR
jgi:prepilin-type processing-associated H-X9-DG protein